MILGVIGCAKPEPAIVTVAPEHRWMDRDIYFAYSNANFENRNNEFQKAKVKDALSEIETRTNLGQGYFNYHEVDESILTPSLTSTVSTEEFKSFILIWPDADFSEFVINKLGGVIPDPNALTVLNAAYKRKFYIIIKASCFSSGVACNGITGSRGLRALIARQFGLMTGLTIKDCTIYPQDVMCSSSPKDTQWDPVNKEIWVASFNNILEAILNNPDFYKMFNGPSQ